MRGEVMTAIRIAMATRIAWPVASILAFGLLAGVGNAQTLEETYAKMCTAANKGSESCQVLRKALKDKLAADDEPVAVVKTKPKSVPARSVAATAASWGFWAALPGSGGFYAPGSLSTYRWVEKNRILESRDEISGLVSTITLRDDGAFDWGNAAATSRLVNAGDGTFLVTDPAGAYRTRISLVEGGLQWASETPKDGGWVQVGAVTSKRISPQEVEDARATLRQAAQPENMRQNWGVYANFVGRTYVNKSWKLRNLWAYEWVVPGLSMSKRYAALMDNTIQAAPTANVPSIVFDPVTKKLSSGVATVQPDGTLLLAMGNMRTMTRLKGSGYEEVTEELKNGTWKHFVTARYEPAGSSDISATIASLTAPAARGGGGGKLAALAGAIGGAAAGAAAGGDAQVILGGAAKGAAMFSSNGGAASALNSVGDSLISGNAAGSFAGGSSGSSSGGSYPTRPNALAGSSACAMMNEGNYRQVGVEGGKDVQLKTMCAQAYEYYTMYKRAITQGYAEADANRTYSAHEQAARNAVSFYGNNSAP